MESHTASPRPNLEFPWSAANGNTAFFFRAEHVTSPHACVQERFCNMGQIWARVIGQADRALRLMTLGNARYCLWWKALRSWKRSIGKGFCPQHSLPLLEAVLLNHRLHIRVKEPARWPDWNTWGRRECWQVCTGQRPHLVAWSKRTRRFGAIGADGACSPSPCSVSTSSCDQDATPEHHSPSERVIGSTAGSLDRLAGIGRKVQEEDLLLDDMGQLPSATVSLRSMAKALIAGCACTEAAEDMTSGCRCPCALDVGESSSTWIVPCICCMRRQRSGLSKTSI